VKKFLDKTSTFDRVVLHPSIEAGGCGEREIQKALRLAEKYSLIWQSISAEVELRPKIIVK